MPQYMTDAGCLDALNRTLNGTFPAQGHNLTLHLFTNEVTPDEATTYTEAAGGGYAAIPLTEGNWTVSVVNNIAQGAYAAQTFTFTGALTGNAGIFGYYVTNAAGTVVAAERLAAAGTTPWFTPSANGQTVTVTPTRQMSHGTPVA